MQTRYPHFLLRLLYRILVIGLVMMTGRVLLAQSSEDYAIRHYGVADGLSNEWIADIEQDAAGFLWIATQYGINRFDGKTFTPYTYRPGDDAGPQANWTRRLLAVSPDTLWLGTLGKGLVMMDTRRERFAPATQSGWPDRDVVGEFFRDQAGRKWVSFIKDLAFLPPSDQSPVIIAGDRSYGIAEDREGRLYGAGIKGLWELLPEDARQRKIADHKAYDLHLLSPDSLIFVDANSVRLLVQKDGNWSSSFWKQPITYAENAFIWPRFEQSPDGEIWLATGKEVWSFSPDLANWKKYDLSVVLGEKGRGCEVHEVFFDREGTMWWGTNRGIFQLRNSPRFYDDSLRKAAGKLPGVREVLVDDSTVWLALPSGLFRWERGAQERPRLISGNYYLALHRAQDRMIYAVWERNGNQQLIRFNARTGEKEETFRPEGSLSEGSNWRIVEDRSGRIWIATWMTLSVYDPKTNQITNLQPKVAGEPVDAGILDMIIDQEDNLWLGTMNGGLLRTKNLSRLPLEQSPEFENFKYDPADRTSISSSLILQIHQGGDGTIWVATDGGLNRFEPGKQRFERYLRSNEMPDDKILSIASTKEGDLWMGTISHGIMHFDPVTEKFRHFIATDGLVGNTMLISSVFQEEDGTIWMGGQDGLQAFNPAEISLEGEAAAPSLIWISTRLIGRDSTSENRFPYLGRQKDNPLKLSPDQHTISWSFSTPTYTEPEAVRYHFKLAGFHAAWLPPQADGQLTLSNLPQGDYQLLVEASHTEEGWRVKHPPIYLSVIPPWYQTLLAKASYLFLAIGLLLFLYRTQLRRRLAEAEGKRIEALAQEKLSWFQRIAHEFRTPLTVIAGAVDRSRNDPAADQEQQLGLIDQQTNHLNGQVGQILEMASLRAEGYRLRQQSGDIVAFHKYLFHSFSTLAEAKGIGLRFHTSVERYFFAFDEDAWQKITGNLLANAIKFTQEGGEITLDIQLREEELCVVVKDNGRGIHPDFQRRLFEPFTREEVASTGTGLGLALASELVALMGGRISVASAPGKGAVFTVGIPAKGQHAPAAQAEPVLDINKDKLPLLLVAEDHPEVLDYIVYCLDQDYRLLTATNGESAWELCHKHQPDLVLSDLLMPGKSGLELAAAIRENPVTDHIPIVLLTARAGSKSRLEGLEAGTDAYLTKPFRREELIATVERLITSRRKLREKYFAGDFSVEPASERTDTFVQSVVTAIESKLGDEAFSVEELASQLHLSRTQLFRKLKSLTGHSPSLFIRKVRLTKAKSDILDTELTIAEIAYRYGYKEPAYFSRVYREEFGESPSESRGR
ncbi:hybrid sensor histidine kinase/response regulator transcription factor [Neolewinella persica]|uniref:hybrid sensor histidine kinase/response regulator transcription factor n=1 Tax=Neolewinella persica TaxID=70998 RepID=UPI00037AF8F8|nr:ATP-binding protein [Neolewinella persica]